MIKVAELTATHRGQAIALAVMAAGLIALAGVGGFELGNAAGQARATQTQVVPPQTCAAQDAPPVTGLQP